MKEGQAFGYNNLVVDMTAIVEMKKFGYPVIFDGTHSVQKPGGMEYLHPEIESMFHIWRKPPLQRGADGLFLETHINPEELYQMVLT